MQLEMQRLKINQDIKPMSEVRNQLAALIKQIHDTKRPLVITQNGKCVAVLIDVNEYEALQEKIELITDIQIGITQLENGEGIDHRDIEKIIMKKAGLI